MERASTTREEHNALLMAIQEQAPSGDCCEIGFCMFDFTCAHPLQGLCIFLLAVGRVVNVFLPLTLGKLVSVFEKDDGTSFWPYLLTYIGLRFLQSNGGIAAVRDVSQQSLNAAEF